MYERLLAIQCGPLAAHSLAAENAEIRIRYQDALAKYPKEHEEVVNTFRELIHNLMCWEYVEYGEVSSVDRYSKPEISKSDRIVEILAINQEYNMYPLFDIVELAAYRQMAIGSFLNNNWKGTILLLNSIVAKCCSVPISTNESSNKQSFYPCLADALLMLSESYIHLSRHEDALKSARLAVDIIHNNMSKFNLEHGVHFDYYDIGPRLSCSQTLVCSYFTLGDLLDKLGLLNFAVGWYKRAASVASQTIPDSLLIEQLNNKYAEAVSFLKLNEDSKESFPQIDESVERLSGQRSNTSSNQPTTELPMVGESLQNQFTKSMVQRPSKPSDVLPDIVSLNQVGKSKSAMPRLLTMATEPSEEDVDVLVIDAPVSVPLATNDSMEKKTSFNNMSELEMDSNFVIDVSNDDLMYNNIVINEPAPAPVVKAERKRDEGSKDKDMYHVKLGYMESNSRSHSNNKKSGYKSNSTLRSSRNQPDFPARGSKHDKKRNHKERMEKQLQEDEDIALRVMHHSATVISACGRGYVTRQYMEAVRRQKTFNSRMKSQHRASVVIQCLVRKYLAKLKVFKLQQLRSSLASLTLKNSQSLEILSLNHAPSQEMMKTLENNPKQLISNRNMQTLLDFIHWERIGIVEKREDLLKEFEKQKLVLDNVLKEWRAKHNSDELVTDDANDARALQLLEYNQLPFKQAPHSVVKYRKGQKIEAKFLAGVVTKNNVTWHSGRILFVHDAKVEYLYDIIYSNGEVELNIRPEFIRMPKMKYVDSFAIAPTDPKANYVSKQTLHRRLAFDSEMHKMAMHMQYDCIQRNTKRTQERLQCKHHNITLIQKVYRGFVVRKYFSRYVRHVLREKMFGGLNINMNKPSKKKLASTGSMNQIEDAKSNKLTTISGSIGFAEFRKFAFKRIKHTSTASKNKKGMNTDVMITSVDQSVHIQNKLLNIEIMNYFELLHKTQEELQSLRSEVYKLSNSNGDAIALKDLQLATLRSSDTEREAAGKSSMLTPGRTPLSTMNSPLFPGMESSATATSILRTGKDYLDVSNNDISMIGNSLDYSMFQAADHAPSVANDTTNSCRKDYLVPGSQIRGMVQDYVQSTIHAALKKK